MHIHAYTQMYIDRKSHTSFCIATTHTHTHFTHSLTYKHKYTPGPCKKRSIGSQLETNQKSNHKKNHHLQLTYRSPKAEELSSIHSHFQVMVSQPWFKNMASVGQADALCPSPSAHQMKHRCRTHPSVTGHIQGMLTGVWEPPRLCSLSACVWRVGTLFPGHPWPVLQRPVASQLPSCSLWNVQVIFLLFVFQCIWLPLQSWVTLGDADPKCHRYSMNMI